MQVSNEIVLRPRFKKELITSGEKTLRAFEKQKKSQKEFIITRVDDHVFIRIPKKDQHFWSPQLHLEIYEIEDQAPTLRGLFGPNPTIWTFFMFLHFVVGTSFIGSGIWMYVNISLNESFIYPIVIMVFLFIIWFVLYFAGRLGKDAGKKEMMALYEFMEHTLNSIQ